MASGDAERQKLFDEWLSDVRHAIRLDNAPQFSDAASCQIFSAMPGVYAAHRLLDWKVSVGPDAEGRVSPAESVAGRQAFKVARIEVLHTS